jgi:hypothetical protein
MISSYRLGDLVLVVLNKGEQQELKKDYPNSIGYDYILQYTPKLNKIDLITSITLKHIERYKSLLPPDIENSSVLHVRLGDVVCGNTSHEKEKRPFDINFLKNIKQNTKLYVIGKCFFAKTSSTNYDECIASSNMYLENVIKELNAEHFDGGSADIDLCCAVKAKYFIQGKGFFSKLIFEIRKKLNLI